MVAFWRCVLEPRRVSRTEAPPSPAGDVPAGSANAGRRRLLAEAAEDPRRTRRLPIGSEEEEGARSSLPSPLCLLAPSLTEPPIPPACNATTMRRPNERARMHPPRRALARSHHFSAALCSKLGVASPPAFINDLAQVGDVAGVTTGRSKRQRYVLACVWHTSSAPV